MATRYVVEDRIYPKPWARRHVVGRARMLARLGFFTLLGFRFRIRERGTDFGPYRARRDILSRVTKRTSFEEFGYKIFVQRKRDGRTLSIHKIYKVDPVPNLGCHPEIEKAYGSLIQKFGPNGIRNGGTWYCRYIDGTHIPSRHGYYGAGWKGAAGDVFSTPDTMSDLYRRAQHVVAETRAGRLKLDGVIVGNQVWWSFDDSWHHYGGVWHSHVHMEVHEGVACL